MSLFCLFDVLAGQPLGIYDDTDGTDPTSYEEQETNGIARDLQKVCCISEEQIKQIVQSVHLQQYRRCRRRKNSDDDTFISTFKIINITILVVLLWCLIFYLNRDYDKVLTNWFIRTFPRESSTFGLFLKNEL